MVKINLLLVDPEYRNAFVESLQRCDISIGVEIISEVTNELFYQYALLVTDKVLAPEELEMLDSTEVVYLSDGAAPSEMSEIFCLTKHAPITEIIAELSQRYAELYGQSYCWNYSGCDFFSVCSTEESEGNIADLSRFIARQTAYICHSRVLLLSLRDLNAYSDNGRECGFERLIYNLQEGRTISLDKFFNKDDYGIFTIKSSSYRNVLSQLSSDDKRWFVGEMTRFFHVIVFHIGSSITRDNERFMRESDLVFSADENLRGLQLMDYPSPKYRELKWNIDVEESEMMALDILRDYYGDSDE